jgi:integrase/recombinase XerD
MQTVERLAPSTINKRIAAIKVYWSHLVQNDYSTLDPTKKVKMKRISSLEQAPKWLSRSE